MILYKPCVCMYAVTELYTWCCHDVLPTFISVYRGHRNHPTLPMHWWAFTLWYLLYLLYTHTHSLSRSLSLIVFHLFLCAYWLWVSVSNRVLQSFITLGPGCINSQFKNNIFVIQDNYINSKCVSQLKLELINLRVWFVSFINNVIFAAIQLGAYYQIITVKVI